MAGLISPQYALRISIPPPPKKKPSFFIFEKYRMGWEGGGDGNILNLRPQNSSFNVLKAMDADFKNTCHCSQYLRKLN